ncbi:MAG TPA: hypothetical protein VLZ09_09395 [Gaiellaceae bacterium]|nr:hypothetical protein [Gaiellaceae bacterium]
MTTEEIIDFIGSAVSFAGTNSYGWDDAKETEAMQAVEDALRGHRPSYCRGGLKMDRDKLKEVVDQHDQWARLVVQQGGTIADTLYVKKEAFDVLLAAARAYLAETAVDTANEYPGGWPKPDA